MMIQRGKRKTEIQMNPIENDIIHAGIDCISDLKYIENFEEIDVYKIVDVESGETD
jgi:hypothetical protein